MFLVLVVKTDIVSPTHSVFSLRVNDIMLNENSRVRIYKLSRSPGIDSASVDRDGILKLLRSPGIDPLESISPGYIGSEGVKKMVNVR